MAIIDYSIQYKHKLESIKKIFEDENMPLYILYSWLIGQKFVQKLSNINSNILNDEMKSIKKQYENRKNQSVMTIKCQNFKSECTETTVDMHKLETSIIGIHNWLLLNIKDTLNQETGIENFRTMEFERLRQWCDEDYPKLVQKKDEAYLDIYYIIFNKIAQSHAFMDGNKRTAFIMLVKILEEIDPNGQCLTRMEYNKIDSMLAGIIDHQDIRKQDFLFLLEYTIGKMSQWNKNTREDYLLYGTKLLPSFE